MDLKPAYTPEWLGLPCGSCPSVTKVDLVVDSAVIVLKVKCEDCGDETNVKLTGSEGNGFKGYD